MALSCFWIIFILRVPLALGQGTMTPDPTFDCTDTNFRVIYTACSAGDYSKCCAVGTSCCAGGCCAPTSICLNVGTSNEVCCPADSANACGYLMSGTKSPGAVQSVACDGSDGLSSYYCPPGSTCEQDGDTCLGGSGGGGGGGGSGSSASSASASSSLPSAAASSATMASQKSQSSEGSAGGHDSTSAASATEVTVVVTTRLGGSDTTSLESASETQLGGPSTVTVTPTSTSRPNAATLRAASNLFTASGLIGLALASVILVLIL